jgi:hypothetical protein
MSFFDELAADDHDSDTLEHYLDASLSRPAKTKNVVHQNAAKVEDTFQPPHEWDKAPTFSSREKATVDVKEPAPSHAKFDLSM